MMHIDEIKESFLNAFNKKAKNKCILPDTPLSSYHFRIFPLQRINVLVDDIKAFSFKSKRYDPLDGNFNYNYAARFIVDMGSEIKFSREGIRSQNIPAHSDIAMSVLTAGNIVFSQDYSEIVGISNKSGHFKTDFSTLVFAIPLILNGPLPLAASIELKNEISKESIKISKDELMNLLPQELKDNITPMLNQNQSQEIFEDIFYKNSMTTSSTISSFPTFFSTQDTAPMSYNLLEDAEPITERAKP